MHVLFNPTPKNIKAWVALKTISMIKLGEIYQRHNEILSSIV